MYKKLNLLSIPSQKKGIFSFHEFSDHLFLLEAKKKTEQHSAAELLVDVSLSSVRSVVCLWDHHCFNKSFSTAPPLASAETGTGVKVGRASEMGFISR